MKLTSGYYFSYISVMKLSFLFLCHFRVQFWPPLITNCGKKNIYVNNQFLHFKESSLMSFSLMLFQFWFIFELDLWIISVILNMAKFIWLNCTSIYNLQRIRGLYGNVVTSIHDACELLYFDTDITYYL